ncbi:hypothetical protein NEPAR04_1017 [Nematocida parisii]|nr:hypothetical protein NEPAR08_1357 [Nematocida parisii]KAI5128930.1 hypothetical protein NEPAR03_1421 [Nematocida parisii]KAI5141516.1 hypothetical protein NEPAR04_1017 [Nematocida parisii]
MQVFSKLVKIVCITALISMSTGHTDGEVLLEESAVVESNSSIMNAIGGTMNKITKSIDMLRSRFLSKFISTDSIREYGSDDIYEIDLDTSDCVIKSPRDTCESNTGLLLQCDPTFNEYAKDSIMYESSDEEVPAGNKLGKRENNWFGYYFNGITVFNHPYIYDIFANKSTPEIINKKENELPRIKRPKRNIFTNTKNFFSIWAPEMKSVFYCMVVIFSVFSTYYLDQTDIPKTSKDFIRKGVQTAINTAKEFIVNSNGNPSLNSTEVSQYIEITRNDIISGKILVFSSLIDLEAVIAREEKIFEMIDQLGMRGSELPKYVHDLANICLEQAGIPVGPAYNGLTHLLKLHMYTYSYEGMISVLQNPYIKDIRREHLDVVFRLFGSEILQILLATRQYFAECILLDGINTS